MANIIKLENFSAPELDIFARLSEAQLLNREHPEDALFIAESPIVIERALDAGCVPVSALVEQSHFESQTQHLLHRLGEILIYTADMDVLTQITGFRLTRGMLCAMHRPSPKSLTEVCAGAKRVAVLENVVNPTNVGAIIRSAAALNVDAVLLTEACSDPLYRRAIRVSMGTVFCLPWAYVGDDWQQELKNLGFKTVAMALTDNSVSIKDPNVCSEEKLAIVLGTEGEGLACSTIAHCDYTVKIPMTHGVDSLNVAAASAVAFFQLCSE